MEYGVEHLKTPLLGIMGHESCGAVTAAYDKVKKGDKIEGNIILKRSSSSFFSFQKSKYILFKGGCIKAKMFMITCFWYII